MSPNCHLLVDFKIQFQSEVPLSEAPSSVLPATATCFFPWWLFISSFCNSCQEFSLSPRWERGMSLFQVSLSHSESYNMKFSHGTFWRHERVIGKIPLQASLLLRPQTQSQSCSSVLLTLDTSVTPLFSQSGDTFL